MEESFQLDIDVIINTHQQFYLSGCRFSYRTNSTKYCIVSYIYIYIYMFDNRYMYKNERIYLLI